MENYWLFMFIGIAFFGFMLFGFNQIRLLIKAQREQIKDTQKGLNTKRT